MKNVHKMLSPGVKGCFYSHYRLWKKCVELDEPIIIWEDDIVLQRPYISVEWNDILIVALGHPTKSEKYKHFLDFPSGDPKAENYYQSSMPGCCGYAIKPHAAKKLIKTYKKTFLPADNAINKNTVEIEIHNYIMGIALTKKDGKKSLTRTNYWGLNK
jgi:glycosyl transferase family 25